MNILKFYNHILGAGSLTSDVEGNISAQLGKATRPFMIEGQRMVLPTLENQRLADKSNIIIFHPLQENMFRGESEVLQKYRNAINLTLNTRLLDLLGHLIELASSPAEHGRLKPAHLDMMAVMKDADEKTFAVWDEIRQVMPPGNSEKCMVHVFIKKNAAIGGRTYRRGAIVSFPLYEDLAKDDLTHVFGVKLKNKMRKKDLAMFRQLLELIFPGIQEKNSYSRGGDSEIAPSLDALLKAVLAVGSQVNAVVDVFEDVLDIGELRYDDSWVEEAANLDVFAGELRLMPMQAGNEGAVDRGQVAGQAQIQQGTQPGTVAMPNPTMIAPTQQYLAGPPAGTVNVVTESGKIDMHALMQANPVLNAMAGPVPGLFGIGAPMATGTAAMRQQNPSWANPVNQFNRTHGSF